MNVASDVKPRPPLGDPTVTWGSPTQIGLVAASGLTWIAAYFTGITYNLIFLVLFVAPLAALGVGMWRWRQGDVLVPVWSLQSLPHTLQVANVLACSLLLGVAFVPAIPNIQLGASYRWWALWVIIGLVAIALASLAPRRRVSVLLNLAVAASSTWLGMQLHRIHTPPSDAVVLEFPLPHEWYVLHGGRSILYNHHFGIPEQRHALDLIAVDGDCYRRNGAGDERYLAFAQPVISPADGVVSLAADKGDPDADGVAGNHVVIDMGDERYVLLAHLRDGSVLVNKGDTVRAGDPIGEVGNTGNSSEPHLHIHVQDGPTLEASDRSWPIVFSGVTLIRGGNERDSDRADLRRDDRVRPADHSVEKPDTPRC